MTQPPEPAIWTALRFLPTACPACRAPFDDPEASSEWAAGEGDSFPEALEDSWRRFAQEHRAGGFVRCSGCGNVTFRLLVERRACASAEEAAALRSDHGFVVVQVGRLAPGSDAAVVIDAANAADADQRQQLRRWLFSDR